MNLFKTQASKIVAMLIVALLSVVFMTAAQFGKNRSHYFVTLNREFYRTHIDFMKKNNFDVAGMDLKKNVVTLIVDKAGRDKLRTILTTGAMAVVKTVSEASPDAQFKTPDQVTKIIGDFATQYPELASDIVIGKSLENRDIHAIKITQNVKGDATNKPVVLFNGMHHAREVMSTEVPLDIAATLLAGYGKDAKITHWLDNNVIYVLPMLNVDGNNMVWTSYNMWRKNTRGGYGVDINRNYPYAWNSCNGSSSSKGADDFHGDSAASEPETNVMMNFVSAIHPVFSISFHSYSELVIYPYGCGNHTETKMVVEPIGAKMAELIVSDDGQGRYTAGTPPELLYGVDGGDIDWLYHEAKVIPFVIEVNSGEQGFQPSYQQWRESTVTRLRPGWQFLLERLDEAGVSGNTNSVAGATNVEVSSQDPNSPYEETHPVRKDGSFFFVLNPGDYVVRVRTTENKNILEQKVHVDHSNVRVNL